MDRVTLGRMQNPVRGLLHGAAAIAAVAGMITLLVVSAGGLGLTLALAVYAGSLVVMFTISSLYHSIPWEVEWKLRMRRLDHSAIFLVVAGTFTPFAVVALEGAWRTTSLVVIWTAGIVGIVIKLVEKQVRLTISVTLQSLMGWAAALPMWQIGRKFGIDTVVLIALGGMFYTAGMIMFLAKRPRLLPRVFSSHELFHVMVVAAAAVHFYAILTRVVPTAV